MGQCENCIRWEGPDRGCSLGGWDPDTISPYGKIKCRGFIFSPKCHNLDGSKEELEKIKEL